MKFADLTKSQPAWSALVEAAAVRERKTFQVNAMFDAQQSVDRQSDKSILEPGYTRSALLQMGMDRSRGHVKSYRLAFASAFADAWTERYTSLKGVAA